MEHLPLEELLWLVTSEMVSIPDVPMAAANDYWIVDWRNVNHVPSNHCARKCVIVQQNTEACSDHWQNPTSGLYLQLCHTVLPQKIGKRCNNNASDRWSHLVCQLDDVLVVLLAASLIRDHRVEPNRIHIYTGDMHILKSIEINSKTSPPAFLARIVSAGEVYTPLLVQMDELVFLCKRMKEYKTQLRQVVVGTDVPRLHAVVHGILSLPPAAPALAPPATPASTPAPARPSTPAPTRPSTPAPTRPSTPPLTRPPTLASALASEDGHTDTYEDALEVIKSYKPVKTPEAWKSAFQAFLYLAKLGRDTEVRQNLLVEIAKDVPTMAHAIAMVMARGSLSKYLPKEYQQKLQVQLASIAGIRSQSSDNPIDHKSVEKLLQQTSKESKAHEILTMAAEILNPKRSQPQKALVSTYKKYLHDHPTWPSFFF